MHARLDPVPTVDVVPLTERRGGGIEGENVRSKVWGRSFSEALANAIRKVCFMRDTRRQVARDDAGM